MSYGNALIMPMFVNPILSSWGPKVLVVNKDA
jgi:hypothetical protein